MSQATLDDDELFDEAASDMREDVEASLDEAREALPEADAIWETEADNTLGVLNGLKSALDVGDAEDLAAAIEDVEELIADVEDAHDAVGDLTSTIPAIRSALEDAADDDED